MYLDVVRFMRKLQLDRSGRELLHARANQGLHFFKSPAVSGGHVAESLSLRSFPRSDSCRNLLIHTHG